MYTFNNFLHDSQAAAGASLSICRLITAPLLEREIIVRDHRGVPSISLVFRTSQEHNCWSFGKLRIGIVWFAQKCFVSCCGGGFQSELDYWNLKSQLTS